MTGPDELLAGPKCLHCGGPCAPGFSTCSRECNLAVRSPELAGEMPSPFDQIPEGVETVSPGELAPIIGKSYGTVLAYIRAKKLPFYQIGPKKYRVDPVAARKALGIHSPNENSAAVTAREVDQALDGEAMAPRGQYLSRALKAAKQSFREVILEMADEAKARGDFAEQARYLEDFIFFEDGLELVYQGRKL